MRIRALVKKKRNPAFPDYIYISMFVEHLVPGSNCAPFRWHWVVCIRVGHVLFYSMWCVCEEVHASCVCETVCSFPFTWHRCQCQPSEIISIKTTCFLYINSYNPHSASSILFIITVHQRNKPRSKSQHMDQACDHNSHALNYLLCMRFLPTGSLFTVQGAGVQKSSGSCHRCLRNLMTVQESLPWHVAPAVLCSLLTCCDFLTGDHR